jgi:endogenous inhibitor of DNA gyrase (YacG/DUF329 family)
MTRWVMDDIRMLSPIEIVPCFFAVLKHRFRSYCPRCGAKLTDRTFSVFHGVSRCHDCDLTMWSGTLERAIETITAATGQSKDELICTRL